MPETHSLHSPFLNTDEDVCAGCGALPGDEHRDDCGEIRCFVHGGKLSACRCSLDHEIDVHQFGIGMEVRALNVRRLTKTEYDDWKAGILDRLNSDDHASSNRRVRDLDRPFSDAG